MILQVKASERHWEFRVFEPAWVKAGRRVDHLICIDTLSVLYCRTYFFSPRPTAENATHFRLLSAMIFIAFRIALSEDSGPMPNCRQISPRQSTTINGTYTFCVDEGGPWALLVNWPRMGLERWGLELVMTSAGLPTSRGWCTGWCWGGCGCGCGLAPAAGRGGAGAIALFPWSG